MILVLKKPRNGWKKSYSVSLMDDIEKKHRRYIQVTWQKSLQYQIGKRSYDRIVETNLTVENQAKSYRREIAKQRLQAFGG